MFSLGPAAAHPACRSDAAHAHPAYANWCVILLVECADRRARLLWPLDADRWVLEGADRWVVLGAGGCWVLGGVDRWVVLDAGYTV